MEIPHSVRNDKTTIIQRRSRRIYTHPKRFLTSFGMTQPLSFRGAAEESLKRQETGNRKQETGDRRQETGDRRQETGHTSHEPRTTTVLSP
ncbi:MAG: hypothetical protein CMC74_12155 [Flavobacteriaceae bacterium]|nr:hypothetical protein [Flavobacteriaceae bacterium]